MPGARIVLLEQDICGGGPSGRNGGFVHGWWENVPYLARRYGRRRPWRSRAAPTRSWTASARGASSTTWTPGTRRPATCASTRSRAQEHDWDATVARLDAPGRRRRARSAGRERGPARCAPRPPSARALWMRSAASIQPARLARGCDASSSSAASGSTRERACARSRRGSGTAAARDRRRPRLRRPGRAGDQRLGQRLAGLPQPAAGLGQLHGRHRADPRAARRARLDRGRAAQRLALHDQLLPDHRRRADRLRRRRRRGRLRRAHRPTFTHDQHAIEPGRRELPPPLPDARRRSARRCVGRADRHHRPSLPGDRLDARWAHALRAWLRRQRRRSGAPGGAHPRRRSSTAREPSLAALPFVGRRPAVPAARAVPLHRRAAGPRGAHPRGRCARRRASPGVVPEARWRASRACSATGSATDSAAARRNR